MPPAKKKVAAKKKAAAKKRVAANKADNVFAFVGTDEGRVRQAAHDCFTRKSNGLDEFGAEVIDGTAENSEDASRIIGRTIEALLTMPFFGGNKVVWLKNANFVADNLTGNSSKTQTALEGITTQLTAGLPMEVTFILSATAIDKRRSFYKRLCAFATVERFD